MTLEIHPAARMELEQSAAWYESVQTGLGERFAHAVFTRLAALLDQPDQGSVRWRAFRETLVDNTFPFLIVYYYSLEEKVVFVSSIFHTSRNPKGKYRRRG